MRFEIRPDYHRYIIRHKTLGYIEFEGDYVDIESFYGLNSLYFVVYLTTLFSNSDYIVLKEKVISKL
jgi:hypothetical protein